MSTEVKSKIEQMCAEAKRTSRALALLSSGQKNAGLLAAAEEIERREGEILAANAEDVRAAEAAGMKASLVDRLRLTHERVAAMAGGIRDVASLADPIGEVISGSLRPNGLKIEKVRVPLGVIGVIYEARPNVTADSFAICFKAGSAVVLRGGSDALRSNRAIASSIRAGLDRAGLPASAVQFVDDSSRDSAQAMMTMNGLIDTLIPRGGAGLIASVVSSSTVPVIETGTGNCHVYVDESADIDMAARIVDNAKTQRLGTCNTCESLLVHEAVADRAIPAICARLASKGIEIRGDARTRELFADAVAATEEDWGTEYLDAIISVKVVNGLDEAIDHINEYSTGHSESIVTRDYASAAAFQRRVDSAAVYVNASTRFTDGGEFGLGAEIGISTQKLHARGPMGLVELTTHKYLISGDGQVRP